MTQLHELKHEAKTRRRNGAVVTMAVLAVLLLGIGVFAAFPRANESVTPPPPAAAVHPDVGPLEPGRYSVLVKGTTPLRAELTLTQPGWEYLDVDGIAREDPVTFMRLWNVDSIYPDPSGFATSDEGLPDGYSPQQLVTALQAQKDTTVSAPTQTTVGGYPALRVVMTASGAMTYLGRLWEDVLGSPRYAGYDEIYPLWIVDVAGTTVVVDWQAGGLTPEAQAIVDSIEFTGM